MSKVNTHNLKMEGLRKASGRTVNASSNGYYIQINYNLRTGEILTTEHVSFGHNSWAEYYDSDIIFICNADNHMTMQEIADVIAEKVERHLRNHSE